MNAVHLYLHGRVQGVGFRHALCAQADAAGLAGWVRNRRDGSVEVVLAGNAAAVEQTVAWARVGPALARVSECFERSATPAEAASATQPLARLATE